jgi:hypothetical protein
MITDEAGFLEIAEKLTSKSFLPAGSMQGQGLREDALLRKRWASQMASAFEAPSGCSGANQ